MFRYAKQRKVLWPVTINAPSEDGSGTIESAEIKLLYELMRRSEAVEIENDIDKAQQVLPSKIHGWEGVADEDGEDIPFSSDALAALLDVPYIERAFAIGLIQASNGAPAKNSKAGSGT
jgi:hypothetical protein